MDPQEFRVRRLKPQALGPRPRTADRIPRSKLVVVSSLAASSAAAPDPAVVTSSDEPFSFLASTLAKELGRVEAEAEVEEGKMEREGDGQEAEEVTAEAALLGRRNSERALRIIQENTEILQRMLTQARRPSALADQVSCARGSGRQLT
ncbi:Protein of unknown function, partial [Gryllus bimaculatus]